MVSQITKSVIHICWCTARTHLHIGKITYFAEALERYRAGTNIQSISARLLLDKCAAIDGQAGNNDMQRLNQLHWFG